MKRISVLMLLVTAAFSQTHGRLADYALVLEDPPVAQKIQSRAALKSSVAQAHLAKVRGAQSSVIAELGRRKVRVTSSAQVLVNAIFVRVAPQDAAALKNIPGVKWMQYLPPAKPMLNAALDLVGAPAAWAAIGGASNAGAGVRIGIIDTGIDQNHPGFQDSSLKAPSGFPAGDTAYTNNKVIVARSYISMIVDSDPNYVMPDDNSPRDRQGHGTAIAMIAAGVQNSGPLGTISGVAPKAFLGNYKVFGSPGVDEYTLFPAWNQALTDAISDGMDIVTLSLGEGDPAIDGPLDVGVNVCGDAICDVRSQAVESATKLGLLVVAAAGNGGDVGAKIPAQNSLNTPGVAPSALTVGASMNRHVLYQTVRVNGSSLGDLRALFSDGPKISSPFTAPVKDVAQLGNDGLGCTALPVGSLNGAFALIQRGTCAFADKINFAHAAGAVGVIIYQSAGNQDITQRLYAQNTGIPSAMISNDDGNALKTYLGVNPSGTLTLDPAMLAADNPQVNTVAPFSSRGPSIGNFAAVRDFALKPEVVAPGVDIYTGTQKYDPNADTYNATGYTRVSGTSYAVPFAAGIAAMALARNPNLKQQPGRLKSAVVNTATADLQGGVHVTDAGAGKVNAIDAVAVAATLEPAAISFGPVTALPIARTLTLTNVSNASATFTLSVRQLTSDSNAQVTLSTPTASLQPGTSAQITVTLTGSRPTAGSYEGFIDVTGAGPALHLPYLYIVGSGVPYNIFPLTNGSFVGAPGDTGWTLRFRLLDPFGAPAANVPVSFRVQTGGGKIEQGTLTTDVLGTGRADVDLGPQQGDQIFIATAGAYTQEFDGYARRLAAIPSGGVVNAASFQVGQGLAPGSYITLFGTDLSDASLTETTTSLPLSLAQIAVSFNGGGKNLPGHLHFVSAKQVNVQIPWEFQGQSSVALTIWYYGFPWGSTYTVPLATYSPGVFAITDGTTGAAITASNPAKRGSVIVLYANGLGPVDTAQSSGDPASSTKLVGTLASPIVSIGGTPATVNFSGLAPGFVGLYQVNVAVPSGAPTGAQTLNLSIGGASVAVNLTIQ